MTARERCYDHVPPIRAETDYRRPDNDRSDGGEPCHDRGFYTSHSASPRLMLEDEHTARTRRAGALGVIRSNLEVRSPRLVDDR